MEKEDFKFLGLKIAIEWIVFLLFFGIGILAYTKGFLIKNFRSIISIIQLSTMKSIENLYSHEFFKLSNFAELENEINYNYPESLKKISMDVIKIELRYTKILLKSNIKYLIANKLELTPKIICDRVTKEFADKETVREMLLLKKGYKKNFIQLLNQELYIYNKFISKGIILISASSSNYRAIVYMLDLFLITYITFKTTIFKKIERAYEQSK